MKCSNHRSCCLGGAWSATKHGSSWAIICTVVQCVKHNCRHLFRWAGLIRGAVSVALVYYFFDPKGKSEDSHRATLIAATLVCVMVSIIVFGALTKTLLDLTLGPQGALGLGFPFSPCSLSVNVRVK